VTTTAVPLSIVTVTIALGLVVPTIGMRLLLVIAPSAGVVIVIGGAAGLTVNVEVVLDTFPVGSLAVAPMV